MLEKALARRDEIYNELKAKPDPRLAWEFQVVYWQGVQVGTAETYDEALRVVAHHLFVSSPTQLDGVNEYMEHRPVDIVKKYEFDDFPDKIGHIELRSGEHDDSIVVCLDSKETVLVEAFRDQWGLWLTVLGGVEIAQEDKTRSFLDALIKCLMELRERNEYALPATREVSPNGPNY